MHLKKYMDTWYSVEFGHAVPPQMLMDVFVYVREEDVNKVDFVRVVKLLWSNFCLCCSSAAVKSSKAVDGSCRPQFGSLCRLWRSLCFSSGALCRCWLYPLSALGFHIAAAMLWPPTNSTVTTLEKSRVTLVCCHKLWAKHPHTVKQNWIKTQ